jgi:hypothetical protein
MPWVHLKIALSLTIPAATYVYAEQLHREQVICAIQQDVGRPHVDSPASTGIREQMAAAHAEALYLDRLVEELGR